MNSVCQNDAISFEKGTKNAFADIVQRYKKDAYFIALGLVGNQEDALDLSQEAFVRAYCNIDKLNSTGKFFPWFYQILRNICFDHLRKNKRRKTSSLNGPDNQNIDTPAPDAFEPDAIAERNESKDIVWQAIAQLEDKHKEVIILRHFHNMTYEKIAQTLFCSKGTVMSRLYYARKKLKNIIDRTKGGCRQ